MQEQDPEKHPRGTSHHNAKLTETDVRNIRASKKSIRALAKEYGVAASTMSAVVRKETWTRVL